MARRVLRSLPGAFGHNAEDLTTFNPLLIWKGELAPTVNTPPPNWECVRKLADRQLSGSVFLMRNRETGIYYVKKYMAEEERQSGIYFTELEILDKVRGHPNITVFWRGEYEWNDDDEPYAYLGIEWCDLGTLDDFVWRAHCHVTDAVLPTGFILKVVEDISCALAYLHTGYNLANDRDRAAARAGTRREWDPILHRDIKLDNIFISSTRDCALPRAVLGDFGHAASKLHYQELETAVPQMYGNNIGLHSELAKNQAYKGFFWDVRMLGNAIADLGAGYRQRYRLHFTMLPNIIRGLVLEMIESTDLDACQVYDKIGILQQNFKREHGTPTALPPYLMPDWDERQPLNASQGAVEQASLRNTDPGIVHSRPKPPHTRCQSADTFHSAQFFAIRDEGSSRGARTRSHSVSSTASENASLALSALALRTHE